MCALRSVFAAPQRAFRIAQPAFLLLRLPFVGLRSRAQTFFIVSANLFSRDEKPPPPNVVGAFGYAARLLANAYSFAFARVSMGQAVVVAL